jgi:hypothetical protein
LIWQYLKSSRLSWAEMKEAVLPDDSSKHTIAYK